MDIVRSLCLSNYATTPWRSLNIKEFVMGQIVRPDEMSPSTARALLKKAFISSDI